MMYPKELFSANMDVTRANIAEYERKRKIWYETAEKMFPSYYKIDLRERIQVNKTVSEAVGFSIF